MQTILQSRAPRQQDMLEIFNPLLLRPPRAAFPRFSSLFHQQRLLLCLHVPDEAMVRLPNHHYDTMVLTNHHPY